MGPECAILCELAGEYFMWDAITYDGILGDGFALGNGFMATVG